MEKHRIPRDSWVLVCDGVKALFLRNDGDAELINLIPVEIYGDKTAFQAPAADRPGRIYQSQGRSRSSVEAVDLKWQSEEAFVSDVARRLDQLVRNRTVKHLIIIAPPKVLGVLRAHLTPTVHSVVKGEVANDFTMLPIPEIEQRLKG
ncbi:MULTISPECIES: baeRF12 domain-containing protein [Rhizobium]|jgi:protein required for attachment to host cells|uniref:baeRF12 domain-containing protein n=1 Tax=Rhizobium TaxID=379 RepID=UPI000DD962A7|nr:host attachment family protein [Rhizobium lusitanum]NTJ11168.1 host attachment protein [Rhizobium lusitanum]